MEIIYKELLYKDLEYTQKQIEDRESKIGRQGGNAKELKEELELLKKVKEVMDGGKWVRAVEWTNR